MFISSERTLSCHLKLQHFSFFNILKSFDALNSRVIPNPNGADSEVGYTVYTTLYNHGDIHRGK